MQKTIKKLLAGFFSSFIVYYAVAMLAAAMFSDGITRAYAVKHLISGAIYSALFAVTFPSILDAVSKNKESGKASDEHKA